MTDTLYDYVEQHAEIIGGALVWTWQEHCTLREQITDDIFYENYCLYSTLDEEYSFFGNREELLKFAKTYDIWDNSDFIDEMRIDEGVLRAEYEDDSTLVQSPRRVHYTDNIANVDAYGGEIVVSLKKKKDGGQ